MSESEAERMLRAQREWKAGPGGDEGGSQNPSARQSGVKTWHIIAGVIGVIVLLGVIGGLTPKTNQSNSPMALNADVEAAATAAADAATDRRLEVTALELARAYQSNEVAAQQSYGDQPLAVSGTVSGVTLDLFNKPVVQLASDNQFMPVSAALADKAAAAALRKGQKIMLNCGNVSEVMSMPQLADCTIAR